MRCAPRATSGPDHLASCGAKESCEDEAKRAAEAAKVKAQEHGKKEQEVLQVRAAIVHAVAPLWLWYRASAVAMCRTCRNV